MPASPAQLAPGLRAAAELARDPARSDSLIALAAQCTSATVLRHRRALERAGVIAPVRALQRTWRTDRPSRNQGASARVAEQLALDPHRSARAIAQAARCSHPTVLQALRQRETAQRDQAAAAQEQAALRARLQDLPWPCRPVTPAGGESFGVGWQRESQAALNLCLAYCPVREQCAAWSLTLPDDAPGVYGGLTQAERLARKHAARPG